MVHMGQQQFRSTGGEGEHLAGLLLIHVLIRLVLKLLEVKLSIGEKVNLDPGKYARFQHASGTTC